MPLPAETPWVIALLIIVGVSIFGLLKTETVVMGGPANRLLAEKDRLCAEKDRQIEYRDQIIARLQPKMDEQTTFIGTMAGSLAKALDILEEKERRARGGSRER